LSSPSSTLTDVGSRADDAASQTGISTSTVALSEPLPASFVLAAASAHGSTVGPEPFDHARESVERGVRLHRHISEST